MLKSRLLIFLYEGLAAALPGQGCNAAYLGTMLPGSINCCYDIAF